VKGGVFVWTLESEKGNRMKKPHQQKWENRLHLLLLKDPEDFKNMEEEANGRGRLGLNFWERDAKNRVCTI